MLLGIAVAGKALVILATAYVSGIHVVQSLKAENELTASRLSVGRQRYE